MKKKDQWLVIQAKIRESCFFFLKQNKENTLLLICSIKFTYLCIIVLNLAMKETGH